ncbi:MAG: sulfatase-like hydrolase/transferase, partial [Planctomycetota bacterium]|nr:sulfatase-like hydrolase/transferase [Planctomycetota bacterium]
MIPAVALPLLAASVPAAVREAPRNVVVVFADDLGPGEVSHAGGVVATPHADRLAAEGTRFTDAHTTSSVCTPSRYSLLTGRYAWRTRLQSGVFSNVAAKPLIAPEEETLASLCRRAGMRTAVFGKWHLGLEWERSDAEP